MTGKYRPGEGKSSPGSHIEIDTLAWLVEEAFDGDPAHSLLANLRDLREEDWSALPPGAERSIADILEHVAWAKWMYEDSAFGPGTLRGDVPPLVPEDGARAQPKDELLEFLKEGHKRWLGFIRALADDSELAHERLANWGEHLPTATLIRILIAHDFYHAGEINHVRCLLQGTDRWPYD